MMAVEPRERKATDRNSVFFSSYLKRITLFSLHLVERVKDSHPSGGEPLT